MGMGDVFVVLVKGDWVVERVGVVLEESDEVFMGGDRGFMALSVVWGTEA